MKDKQHKTQGHPQKTQKSEEFWVDLPPTTPGIQLKAELAHASKTDPQGSWTGVPHDPGEKPVQDADDL